MELILVTTTTEDWHNFENVKTFQDYATSKGWCRSTNQSYEQFFERLKQWEETLSPSFFEVRTQMKEIAEKNWSRLDCEVYRSDRGPDFNKDTIVIISDDDDWYNPAVIEDVKEVFRERDDIDIVYWDCWQYSTFSVEKFIKNDSIIGSNCFALRGGFHWNCYSAGAHTRIHDNFDKEKIMYLPNKELSLWNVHLASYSILSSMSSKDGIEKYGIMSDKRAVRPSHLDWAKKEIEELYRLMKSVNFS